MQKIVPALVAGCTVVHKPSEVTPLHSYLLAQIIADCDLPPGVQPTVFGSVDDSSTIATQEIFGPVLSVIACHGEDDAARIANCTPYGLHGAIWSADLERAKGFARRIRTRLLDINGGQFNILAPFGGFKQSGIGRECGIEGLDSFCEIKSLQLPQGRNEPTGPRLRGDT